jgi:ATPase subunit of ABC transporter with duplicated ATPase domains
MAQSRIKALEKIQKVSRVRQDADVVLTFPKPDLIAGPLIQLIDVSFGYTVPPATIPEKMLFSNVILSIDAESRIALVRVIMLCHHVEDMGWRWVGVEGLGWQERCCVASVRLAD